MGGGFERLLHKKKIVERLISFIFDETHCISIWASFQKEFAEMGLLRILLCKDVPLVATSAIAGKQQNGKRNLINCFFSLSKRNCHSGCTVYKCFVPGSLER